MKPSACRAAFGLAVLFFGRFSSAEILTGDVQMSIISISISIGISMAL